MEAGKKGGSRVAAERKQGTGLQRTPGWCVRGMATEDVRGNGNDKANLEGIHGKSQAVASATGGEKTSPECWMRFRDAPTWAFRGKPKHQRSDQPTAGRQLEKLPYTMQREEQNSCNLAEQAGKGMSQYQ